MAQRRRIVPDTSVIIPALFRETIPYQGNPFDLTRRARPIFDAIWDRRVDAYAPHLLMSEFMTAARRKGAPRDNRNPIPLDDVKEQCQQFLRLCPAPPGKQRLTLVDSAELAELAWDLLETHDLSSTDVWFLACAKLMDAELWISHRQQDRFPAAAKSAWPKVFVLTETHF